MVRHFTVQEANALLETVRPLVERMVEQRHEVVHQLERKQELGGLTQTTAAVSRRACRPRSTRRSTPQRASSSAPSRS